MTLSVISLLFFGSGVIVISVFVLLKRWDKLSRSWLYFSIVVAMYAFGYAYLSNNNIDNGIALLASRIGTTSAAVIPLTWLHFVCNFLNVRQSKILWISAPLTFLFVTVGMTDWFIPGISPARNYIHYPVPGPLYYLHVIHFSSVVTYSFFLMSISWIKEKDIETKKEIFSLLTATLAGFVAGSSEFSLILFRDRGFDLTVFLVSYPFLMAYAMIKHRTFDIEKVADAFQKEKLAAIGILAASVNHELKSPLFVVRSSLEVGLRKIKDQSLSAEGIREAFVRAAEKSIAQVDRAVEIMQRLTEFARPGSSQTETDRVVVGELFSKVLELLNSQFTFSKIRLTKDIDEGLVISANKRQLEEILFNLILNACQAMSQGSDLFLGAQKKGQSVRIEIRDTGSGIPQSDRDQIFEPFYTTKEKTGTGLGLYVTKQLTERNGGKLWFESSPQGTTFFIEFTKGTFEQ